MNVGDEFMENKIIDQKTTENKSRDYYTIDLGRLFQALWRKAWMIMLIGVLTAAIGFSVAAFLIRPTYSSSVMLYVNNIGNTQNSGADTTISHSQLTAAQSLVKTYGEFLNNRTTLELVIKETGVSYDYETLQKMINVAPSNDTEVMKVTVTSEDPDEAALIANGIAKVLSERVEVIIDTPMVVVDYAVPNYNKVAPSITMYTAIGFLIGFLIMVAIVVILELMDDRIHDEEYVLQTYECPILAKIPDLLDDGNKRYGYYYRYRKKNTAKQDEGEVAK